ncbi:MAG: CotH kinase family protein [Candidatus Symbiothrix sp.]|jgi:hypothetical protein|nr:CotH kinase family protein [Candidatus Symbiothrix sp.]
MRTIYFLGSVGFLLFFSAVGFAQQLTDLPTFHIHTAGNTSITSKTNYVQGTLTINSSNEQENVTGLPLGIRGRGNSTWGMPKKPYRIKLDQKNNLLGLPAKEKDWVLLANYADKTLIRNALAFKIGELLTMEFSPSFRFVDVVLNGSFLGNYMLTDQIEVGKQRVPVEKQSITDTGHPEITGGYLLEIDGFASGEPLWFQTPKGLKITIKYPDEDEINTQQTNYIKNYLLDFESILFSSNFDNEETGYRAWVDETSLVNWYIACELTGNSDSFWSTYLYKKRNDKHIYFGPLWDYDIAFNNDRRLGDATQKLMRNYAHAPRTWIERIWQDTWFKNAVNERWKELIANGLENSLLDFITQTGLSLQSSQEMNFDQWKILNKRVYNEVYLFDTYHKGTDYLKTYMQERIAFLTSSFEKVDLNKPSEPFVPENYYYWVMNNRTNNVITATDNPQNPGDWLSLWAPDAEVSDDQLWEITPVDNHYFRFIHKRSNLAIAGAGKGNNLILATINDNDSKQKWEIVPVLTGNIYGIVNVASNYSVNNNAGSFDNGNPVIEWDNDITSSSKPNQHWYLQKIEAINPSTAVSVIHPLNPVVCMDKHQLRVQNLPEQAGVQIYNLQGIPVAEKQGSREITFETPRPGIYILRITTKNNVWSIKVNVQ